MERDVKLEEEKCKIEEEISQLNLQITKADIASDEDDKLSPTRDDETAVLVEEMKNKQARLEDINKMLGIPDF